MSAPAAALGQPGRTTSAIRLRPRASVVLAVASVLGALAFCWPLFIVGHANANLAHSQTRPGSSWRCSRSCWRWC